MARRQAGARQALARRGSCARDLAPGWARALGHSQWPRCQRPRRWWTSQPWRRARPRREPRELRQWSASQSDWGWSDRNVRARSPPAELWGVCRLQRADPLSRGIHVPRCRALCEGAGRPAISRPRAFGLAHTAMDPAAPVPLGRAAQLVHWESESALSASSTTGAVQCSRSNSIRAQLGQLDADTATKLQPAVPRSPARSTDPPAAGVGRPAAAQEGSTKPQPTRATPPALAGPSSPVPGRAESEWRSCRAACWRGWLGAE